MLKRSAIVLLILTLGSISLLLFASGNPAAASIPPGNEPVKCSGGCNKKTLAPVPWNIISPAMFQNQG